MRVIRYRNVVNKSGDQEIHIDSEAKLISVEADRYGANTIHLWFDSAVNGGDPRPRNIRVVRLDQPFPEGYSYVGSTIGNDNRNIHIYEERQDGKTEDLPTAITD